MTATSYHATYGWDVKGEVTISNGGNYGMYHLTKISTTAYGGTIYGSRVFRMSINWDGCGSWTPTPGASCGDTRDLKVYIS